MMLFGRRSALFSFCSRRAISLVILCSLVSTALIVFSVTIADPSRVTSRQVAESSEVVQDDRMALAARQNARIIGVIEDITEMLKQAQDPIHALFIPHFFLSVFKQLLPDRTPWDRDRSVRFLLANFAQMKRIRVRIADAGQSGASSEPAHLNVLGATKISASLPFTV
jgi:hypothetical protein